MTQEKIKKTDFSKVFNVAYALERLPAIDFNDHRLELANYKKLGEKEGEFSHNFLKNNKFTF